MLILRYQGTIVDLRDVSTVGVATLQRIRAIFESRGYEVEYV
jgi:hypothetical protein